jgi:hypothetical protein
MGGSFLNWPGLNSGFISSSVNLAPGTLLGPMNVEVTLIDNAGNQSNTVTVPVSQWFDPSF